MKKALEYTAALLAILSSASVFLYVYIGLYDLIGSSFGLGLGAVIFIAPLCMAAALVLSYIFYQLEYVKPFEPSNTALRIKFLLIVVAAISAHAYFGGSLERFESSHSKKTNIVDRYTSKIIKINMRPAGSTFARPANHLFSIENSRIMSPPNKGRMQDRIEIRFLLPDFGPRTAEREEVFSDPDGKNILALIIKNKRNGMNGDIRRLRYVIPRNTTNLSQVTSELLDTATEQRKNSPELAIKHDNLGLLEYYSNDGVSSYFESGATIFRCWSKSNYAICKGSHSLTPQIIVNYTFPRTYLPQWKEIDNFVKQTTTKYLVDE
ncbi:MAG: hypothetical protein Q8Q55_01400 [Undibacterium sp.]|nr:hypothetical protein [Undibacterium sp.]